MNEIEDLITLFLYLSSSSNAIKPFTQRSFYVFEQGQGQKGSGKDGEKGRQSVEI